MKRDKNHRFQKMIPIEITTNSPFGFTPFEIKNKIAKNKKLSIIKSGINKVLNQNERAIKYNW
jgi:hypothetical protein